MRSEYEDLDEEMFNSWPSKNYRAWDIYNTVQHGKRLSRSFHESGDIALTNLRLIVVCSQTDSDVFA